MTVSGNEFFDPIVVCKYPVPPSEVCDGQDNDLDGQTDEDGFGGTVCPQDGGTSTGPDAGGDGGLSCGSEICADGQDNDCDGAVDEDCAPGEIDGGGPVGSNRGLYCYDPVNLASGSSFEQVKDLSVGDGLTTLTFERTFSSRGDEWIYDAPLVGVPKPFGGSPNNPESVEWWHNWLSVVVEHQYHWSVRTPDGGLLRFLPCAGSTCEAVPAQGNQSRPERLTRTPTGYELRQSDGTLLVYESLFLAPREGRRRYFLSRVVSGAGINLAQLNYAQPNLTGCAQGATGSSPGVPYLSSVQSPAGASLSFDYRVLARSAGGVDCVIDRVRSLPYQAHPQESVVYAYTTQGGVERPGRIGTAEKRSRLERYLYTAGEFQRSEAGVLLVRHTYGADGRVASATGGGYGAALSWEPTAGACQPGSNCCGRTPQVRQAVDSYAGRGDGTEGAAGLLSTYATLSNYGQENAPRMYQTQDACTVSGACSPGSVRSEWTCSSPGNPGKEIARKDKRGNWQVFGYSLSPEASPRLELASVKRGASDMLGTGALEETQYTYTYANGQQLPQVEEEASVLGGATNRKRTLHVYAPGTNRTKALIRSGWTRVRGSNGTWTTERRFVGTFFLTTFNEDQEDPLGRVREIHGPCWVASESATDCPTTTPYPVTRYVYFEPNATSAHGNRLSQTLVYPAGGPVDPSSVVLGTGYDHEFGSGWSRIESIVDANWRLTKNFYNEDRLVRTEEGAHEAYRSKLITYGYQSDKYLSYISNPEEDFHVFCYRTGASPDGRCTSGAMSDKLQWVAHARGADGTGWTEKTVYAYWPDGTLKEESFLLQTGTGVQTRRVMKYAADAHKRPTWNKWGEGAGSFSAARSFDGADNLTGVGHAFNNPPAWCGGVKTGMGPLENGTPLSQLCSSLAYDRANRLVQVDEYPADGVSQRTLFSYDVQGNVAGVKVGCQSTDTFATCAQPASTYSYDDFGQVVEVFLPHADGPARYAYDAQGNQVVKETAAMRQAGEYVFTTYDMLSRLVSVQRVHATGSELLYRLGYDDQGTPPSSCPAVKYTKGRLRYREDSFGTTWFSYDLWGNVLGEFRVRAGTTTCGSVANANPHTLYTYTLNGNLQSVTYPNGRTVTYVYGTGGNTNRVSAVDVTLYDGTAWTTRRLLSNVTWEPYGGLRGYTLNQPGASGAMTVEYGLGDDGSVLPAGCSTSFPSAANSDLTGRLRSLRVSSGSVAMGAGTGDIYQRTYTWKADQVVRTDTCLLGQNATPMQETYAYDRTLRLTVAGRTAGNFSATGGAFGSRVYTYDRRGNRTAMTSEDANYFLNYATDSVGHKDRLMGWGSIAANSQLGYTLAYDVEGRVTRKADLGEDTTLAFEYGPSVGVATESVFRAVEVDGAFYNYYYDALGRRRQKSYPGGTSDEFFYMGANQMLVDRGSSDVVTPVAHYMQDDYVWLGGRPVVLVRGKLSNTWTRLADTSADCTRNGEASACGVYFPVTDHLGKPVLMLDGKGKVAGAVDYEPFGHVNRVGLVAETAHPLDNDSSSIQTLGAMVQPTGTSPLANNAMSVKMRALFHKVDLTAGQVEVVDANLGMVLASVSGTGRGRTWSDWVTPFTGRANVRLAWPGGKASTTSQGVVLEGYEYQRYQTGAQPFWMPLRFPGQYHDAETDLFENWNRYYDPSIGRYLQPEPLLQYPEWVAPAYAYALNNPLHYTDPDGRQAVPLPVPPPPLIPSIRPPHPVIVIPLAICLGIKRCREFLEKPLDAWDPSDSESDEEYAPKTEEELLDMINECGSVKQHPDCGWLEGSGYNYPSPDELVCEGEEPQDPKEHTHGLCPGYKGHYYLKKKGVYQGRNRSVVCCPCCLGNKRQDRCRER
ncbi:RHS repeat-associated core domain-containing protein [Cystobacter fuscus]|uniref:RHS repeat-associated core domain-containing protein n=1 Tax=Cystobacter fuscus TaxID=43 RepID=UPI0037BF0083